MEKLSLFVIALIAPCIHKGVCVYIVFLCMFCEFHFHSVINSPSFCRPQRFALLVFAPLCSHFVLNPQTHIILTHFLCFTHFFSPPSLPFVKSATSATLFRPSQGTLARAGQWILMSALRARSVKARRRDPCIPWLRRSSQTDMMTCPRPMFSLSPFPFSLLTLGSRTDVIAKSLRRLSGSFVDGGKSSLEL